MPNQIEQQSPELANAELNTTVEGGKYIVNGQTVNAEGDPLRGTKSNENEADEEADKKETKNQKGK